MKRLILALGAVMALSGAALAQGTPNSSTVVATCGTPSGTYSPGQNKPVTQGTDGQACVKTTISGTVVTSNASVGATGSAVPASGTYVGINVGGNLTGAVGGHGTAAGAIRVELPTDGTGVVGLNAGTNVIGHVINDASSAVIGHVITDNTSVTAASQSGTWNITNVSGTVSLPTGASTAAAQTNVQSSPGTPQTTAITVQGNASGVAVPISGTVTITPSGTQGVNLAQVNGASVNVGTGAAGTGTQRVTTSSDSTLGLVAGSAIIGKVGIDQTTPGTTNAVSATNFPTTVSTGTGAQGASSPRVTVATDTATIAGSAPGTTASPSTNAVSSVDLSSAASTAGVAPVSSTSLEANHVIKSGAGNLYSFEVAADTTLSGAAWWLMIYNATSAPADGAVTPAKCYALPSGTTGFSGAFAHPLYLGTGITLGVSTTGCFSKTASSHAFLSGDSQ